MANIFDVAKYILNTIGDVSTMKLQKLCYYSQSIHLVKTEGIPLFDEDFEAWANGPVSRDLFNVHKGAFIVNNKFLRNELLTNTLTTDEISSINVCLDKYGVYSAAQLSDMTHEETPWKEARGDVADGINCNKIVSKKSIAIFYTHQD